ncbi:glutamine amidotransferase-related protein, partial [Citrobacter youngae]|uniref:glutamine amidotransferase-related protein n=1 Tax=Citrobacter youngae TaxID=133448 RepID=UPI003EE1A325
MILLIDNYDSFTWNLYQYFCELGADVLVRRNDALTLAQIDALNPQKIVISPGPCTPDDAGISLEVIRYFAGKIPLLGAVLVGDTSDYGNLLQLVLNAIELPENPDSLI